MSKTVSKTVRVSNYPAETLGFGVRPDFSYSYGKIATKMAWGGNGGWCKVVRSCKAELIFGSRGRPWARHPGLRINQQLSRFEAPVEVLVQVELHGPAHLGPYGA